MANSEGSIWGSHPTLRHGVRVPLQADEKDFWDSLIAEFLQPEKLSDASKVHELQGKLDTLRNRIASIVLFCNVVYVLAIVLIKNPRSILYHIWSLGGGLANNSVAAHTDSQQLELIVVAVAFFAFILIVQLCAMMVHRFRTFSHLLASVSTVDSSESKANEAACLSAFRKLQMPDTLDDLSPPVKTVDLEFVLDHNLKSVNSGKGHRVGAEEDTGLLRRSRSRDALAGKVAHGDL